MTRNKVQAAAVRRRNFLPALIITLLLWLAVILLIVYIDPGTFGALISFFVLSFLAIYFTFSIIFANKRWGLLIAFSMSFFVLLRYIGVGHIVNLLLIVGIATVVELYLANK